MECFTSPCRLRVIWCGSTICWNFVVYNIFVFITNNWPVLYSFYFGKFNLYLPLIFNQMRNKTYHSVKTVPKTYHTVKTVPKTYHTIKTVPKTYHTVKTVPKTYHTVKTIPKTYHTIKTVPKTYHTVKTVPKSNRKMVETKAKSIHCCPMVV